MPKARARFEVKARALVALEARVRLEFVAELSVSQAVPVLDVEIVLGLRNA